MCAYVYMYVCECRYGCDRVHMQRSENNLRCQSLPSSSFEAGPLSWLCLLACRSTETADAHHPTRLWPHVVTLAWQPSFPLNLLTGPHTSLLPSEGCSFFHCGLVLLEWCHAVWAACLASVTGIWACACFVLFSVFLSFTTLYRHLHCPVLLLLGQCCHDVMTHLSIFCFLFRVAMGVGHRTSTCPKWKLWQFRVFSSSFMLISSL